MHHRAFKCQHQPADRQKIHYNIDERSQRPARPAKNLSDQADRIAESVYLIKRKQEFFSKAGFNILSDAKPESGLRAAYGCIQPLTIHSTRSVSPYEN